MAGTKSAKQVTDSSSAAALAELLGQGHALSPEQLDPWLVWMSVVSLLSKGAALQLAMNRAKSSYILTVFDGDYPHKEFCDTVDRAHQVLWAIVMAYRGKQVPPEWQQRADELGLR